MLAAALLVGAGAGCGGSDESEPTAAPTAAATTEAAPVETRPEPPAEQSRWAQEVDRACEPWQQRIQAVTLPADTGDLERYLNETLPLIRKQVAAVDAVKLPPSKPDARQATLFVTGLRDLEGALTKYAAALHAGNPEQTEQALANANSAGLQLRTYVAPLGVTQCGAYEGG